MNSLKNHGYEHYEISNYAKNKAYSHHNMTYWRNLEYLGIGSGAHSLINERRYFNVSSVAKYIDAIKTKKDYQTSYTRNAFEEYCMTGLRMMQGISLQTIEEEFSISLLKKYPILQNYITSGLLQLQGDYLSLTPKGILLGNEIFQLFLEEESC
jgi:oxygen-independent coproporphyrinogen-3 oxidase